MSPWDTVLARTTEIAHLRSAAGVLGWDQQVNLPDAGHAARGAQSALLSRLAHERLVDPALQDDIAEAREADLTPRQAAALDVLERDLRRAVRVPGRLVQALSEAASDGFRAWAKAKADDDFDSFAPALERIFALKREEAAAIDADRHPYDVHVEAFDPGSTLADLRPMFDRLAAGLQPLLDGAADGPAPPTLPTGLSLDAQERLHRRILEVMGFDFSAGRLDASEHPFTAGIAAGDIRLTTHLYEDDLLSGLGGTMHEGGHGLYEQGLPKTEAPGTGLGQAAGLGLHESQSRFWENQLGRSLPFLRWLSPQLQTHLGIDVDADTLYRAANPIRPSLIRVFADEATYNLHIIARFRLEVAMLEDDLPIADLPGAWRDQYRELLGIEVPTDREGCLQDVHWGSGAVGYFPSYTLGNLAAARFGKALERDLPDLWEHVGRADLQPILAWLRDKVHRHGQAHTADEIVTMACGEGDGVADLLDHLHERHGTLYGVRR